MEHKTIKLIFLDVDRQGGFDIMVALPNGETRCTYFTPPFDLAMLQSDLVRTDSLAPGKARARGQQLFAALFSASLEGDLKNAYDDLKDGEMVRIDLCFDPLKADHQTLSSLPWELMYWEQKAKHLVLNKKVLLNRHLLVREQTEKPKTMRRLSVLAVIANPRDTAVSQFDAEAFRTCLKDALGAACDLDFLSVPTILQLSEQLGRKNYDILHFTGHGGRSHEEWGMCFETVAGDLDFVSAQVLRNMLDDYPDLRFINLVSCNLSHGQTPLGQETLSGVAHSLVNQGIPAVAAMQFTIACDHAQIFMQAFYACLIETLSLEAALDRARKRLYDSNREGLAFASPVLYFRGQGSCLWEREPPVRVFLNSRSRNLPARAGVEILDFADFFEAKDGETTHRIRQQEDWLAIYAKISYFKNRGWEGRELEFDGNAYLPIWFAVGFVFRSPGKFKALVQQYNQRTERIERWRPNRERAPLAIDCELPGAILGGELIVTINVSSPTLHEDVMKYRVEQPHLRHLPMLKLSVPAASRGAIKDEDEAIGYVNAFVNQIRNLVSPERIHLFLAMPQAMAFLIAHELAVSGELVLYAHANSGYVVAFTLR